MNRGLFIKILLIIYFSISFAPQVAAQNDFEEYMGRHRSEFNQYRKKVKNDFEEYTKRRNEEFAEFLNKQWEMFDVEKPVEHEKPEPPQPVYAPVDNIPEDRPSVEVPVSDFIDNEIPKQNKPVDFHVSIPQDGSEVEDVPMSYVYFYGENLKFSYDKSKMMLRLKGTDESNVSDAWSFLSSSDYDMLIHECLSYAKDNSLGDWGLFKLVETLAQQTHGKGTNESYVVMAYIMSQLGYDARICRIGSKLSVMIPIGPSIAEYPYIKIGSYNYYIFGSADSGSIYTYDSAFEGATRIVNLYRQDVPRLGISFVSSRTFASKKFPEMVCHTYINKNLMLFYADMPAAMDFAYYVLQPCDDKTMDMVYSALRNSISGKKEVESVNMILDFVQQGFEYETDDKQFGHEKYNFPEETFFYKACDCDDRAILFATLIRKLTELDVVLVDYPNHLATAVRFNTPISGDYITVKGQKYFICDPTYIGASAGMEMPSVDSSKLKVYQINK